MYNNSMIAAVNATLPIVAIVAVDSILNFGTTVVIMKYLVEMNFIVQKLRICTIRLVLKTGESIPNLSLCTNMDMPK